MKKILLAIVVMSVGMVVGTGCSTMGKFKIPADTKLTITDRQLTPSSNGEVSTTPFFWSSIGGAEYKLTDKNGKVIRTGKVKTKFRVVSIFWPPAAIIYWPVGFAGGEFDLTAPGDGYMVTDTTPLPPASTLKAAPAAAVAAPAKVKVKKKKSDAAPAATTAN